MDRAKEYILIGVGAAIITVIAFTGIADILNTSAQELYEPTINKFPENSTPTATSQSFTKFEVERPKFTPTTSVPYIYQCDFPIFPEPDFTEISGSEPTKPEFDWNFEKLANPFEVSMRKPNPGDLMNFGHVPPAMPKDATKSGSCVAQPLVNDKGQVTQLGLIKCSESLFEKPTTKYVMKWRYYPMRKSGKYVAFEAKPVTVRFKLHDENGNIIPE